MVPIRIITFVLLLGLTSILGQIISVQQNEGKTNLNKLKSIKNIGRKLNKRLLENRRRTSNFQIKSSRIFFLCKILTTNFWFFKKITLRDFR